jgi:hypothetical protein
MEEQIKLNLDILADYKSQLDLLDLQKREMIDGVLTPEIRQAMADIEAEFSGKSDLVNARIAGIRLEIDRDVLQYGATVKGAHMMAIWVKPRVTWDTKGLNGYGLAYPEIMAFQKVGEPSVTIRNI